MIKFLDDFLTLIKEEIKGAEFNNLMQKLHQALCYGSDAQWDRTIDQPAKTQIYVQTS